ncbi:hypothetical protein Tco_1220773 [Tanacetum coccineum]
MMSETTPFAITPGFTKRGANNSIVWGDEHLDTIPGNGIRLEFIKSNLTFLSLKVHSEDYHRLSDDSTSSDDDSYENIEYVDASSPDVEIVSLEVVEIVDPEVGRINDDILLKIKDDILRIFLPFSRIQLLPPYLFCGNEDIIFDPGHLNLYSFMRDVSHRYVGPFKVLEKVGSVAYKLELPEELSRVHNTFHVSNLKKCYADEPLAVPLDGLHFDDKLQFVEEPIEITDREVKRLKRSRIPLVKVRWNSRRGPEFTWEREDQFRKKYPHLFTKTAPSSSAAS